MPLKVRAKKGRRHLYVRGTVRGQYIEKSTGTSDRAAAEALRIKWEKELLDRSIFGRTATAGFAEALVLYLEAGGERRFTARLLDHFQNTKLKDIDQAAVDVAARTLYPTAKPATVVRQVYTPMTAVMNHAHLCGLCPPVRFKRPKVRTRERPAAEPEQLLAFLEVAPQRIAALATFMAYTGRRVGEAVNLRWDDVNLGRSQALIPDPTKNGEPFMVYLPSVVVATLAYLPHRTGRVFGYASRHSVYGPWKKACEKAQIPYLSPHEMGRHTFATWMRRYGGLDLRGLMEAGGWRSIASVIRYLKVTPTEAQTAADDLPNLAKTGTANDK